MIQVQITGVTQAQIDLKRRISPEKIRIILIKAGFMIEGIAKRKCPVDTGRLRASISTNWDESGMAHGQILAPVKDSEIKDGVEPPKKKSNELAVVRVGSNVEYASCVEMGTERQSPQPYLLPAYMNVAPKIKTMLENEMKKRR